MTLESGGTEDFSELAAELAELFGQGVQAPLPEEDFNEMALRVFRFQCRANEAYGAFVEARGIRPGELSGWEEIPHLPTQAFKVRPLVSGGPDSAERIFLTSGTSGGRAERGAHHVLSLELYRASLLPNFMAHLLPEKESLPVFCLLPSPREAPESSLSFMMGRVVEAMGPVPEGAPDHGFFLDPTGGVRWEELLARLRAAEEAETPVLLAGTAFSFVHWLELAGEAGVKVRLPPGSRIMETGGFKGRSRVLPREELYRGMEEAFRIPAARMVNEYGMTELLSQFYEPVLLESEEGGAGEDLSHRFHRGPPWVRSRVLDPLSLEPVPRGEVGILAHLDLANVGSVAAVLTEDLGQEVEGGFRLLGRAQGAEPRGCSLAMEDFLTSGGGSS